MPSLLKHVECPSCGHRHHFFLANGGLVAGTEYEYYCPEIGQHGKIRPGSTGEIIKTPPQGAVLLESVKALQSNR